MGSASWRRRAVPRYDGEVSQHSPSCPAAPYLWAHWASAHIFLPVPQSSRTSSGSCIWSGNGLINCRSGCRTFSLTARAAPVRPAELGMLRPGRPVWTECHSCVLCLTPPALSNLLSLLNFVISLFTATVSSVFISLCIIAFSIPVFLLFVVSLLFLSRSASSCPLSLCICLSLPFFF